MESSYVGNSEINNRSLVIVSEKKSQNSFFDFFPNELLMEILFYLKQDAKQTWEILFVSKKWCHIGKKLLDPSFQNNRWIILASKMGKVEVVKNLLKDSRVNPADQGNLAIFWASKYGHPEVMKELLKDKRVDPSIQNNCVYENFLASNRNYIGDIIIWKSRDHKDVIKELLKDPRVVPSSVPIYLVDNVKELKQILNNRNARSQDWVWKQVCYIAKKNGLDALDELLDDQCFIRRFGENAICWASYKGDLEIVKKLIKIGKVNPSARKNEPLVLASKKGHVNVVKELLKNKVDPSYGAGSTALRLASAYGRVEVVRELLKDPRVGLSEKHRALRPIWGAINGKHYDVVQELLMDKRIEQCDLEEALNCADDKIFNLVKDDPRIPLGTRLKAKLMLKIFR